MSSQFQWYQALEKPFFAPPSWLFGPVWAVLYAIIFISFGYVFWQVLKGNLPWFVAVPLAFNLVCNFAFTPLQFGMQNNMLAAIDILFVLGTLVWAGVVLYPLVPWVVYANIPYFLWVSFATVLQLTITYLNW